MQVGLLPQGHHHGVAKPDTLLTPAQRIAWAIEDSGKTMTALAEEVGCSHATLSQWANARTEAENIKAALLQRFADATGVEVRWLLTGEGVVRNSYTTNYSSLVLLAREVAEQDGLLAAQAERVLRAMLPER